MYLIAYNCLEATNEFTSLISIALQSCRHYLHPALFRVIELKIEQKKWEELKKVPPDLTTFHIQ